MDSDNTHYYQYPFYLLPDVKSATQTSKVDKYVFLPYAQALSNTGEHPDTLEWTDLLTSSDSAYIKTDVANIRSVEKEATDQSGQFTLAANVTDNETGADITIVGSSLVFTQDRILHCSKAFSVVHPLQNPQFLLMQNSIPIRICL